MRPPDSVRYRAAVIFAVTELVLGSMIQVLSGRTLDFICFGSVALAFAFCSAFAGRTRDGYITLLGMAFTVLADLFLVLILPRQRMLAMMFFVIVQLCYFLRLARGVSTVKRYIHIGVRLALSILGIILTIVVLGERADALSIISMFYFVNLLVNIVYAFLMGRRALVFALGLLCFALCDVFVGLDVLLSEYIVMPMSEPMTAMAWGIGGVNLVWLFYVPAQTLIAISAMSDICANAKDKSIK